MLISLVCLVSIEYNLADYYFFDYKLFAICTRLLELHHHWITWLAHHSLGDVIRVPLFPT